LNLKSLRGIFIENFGRGVMGKRNNCNEKKTEAGGGGTGIFTFTVGRAESGQQVIPGIDGGGVTGK